MIESTSQAGWAHLVALLIAGALAVLAMGTHQWLAEREEDPTPPLSEEGGHGDDTDIDLALDTDDTDPREAARGDVDLAQDASRLVWNGGSYSDWVRILMEAHEVSESTAKRAIATARRDA